MTGELFPPAFSRHIEQTSGPVARALCVAATAGLAPAGTLQGRSPRPFGPAASSWRISSWARSASHKAAGRCRAG